MLQFNVSLGGKDTMVGGSGGPARPRNHGGGMLITHHYTLLHIITRKSFLLHTLCNKSPENHDYYTSLHTVTQSKSHGVMSTLLHCLLHLVTRHYTLITRS